MSENIEHSKESWDHLEDWLRGQVQGLTSTSRRGGDDLGSARRSGSDSDSGYRNGHSLPGSSLSSGTIRVPRVRDTEERFESRLLPLFVKRSRQIAELPENGLSDSLALRGLLGDDAPLSASTVSRRRGGTPSCPSRGRRLDELEVVYVWGGRGVREGRF